MNVLELIMLSLGILKAVRESLPKNGTYDLVIQSIEAAIGEIEKVRGTEVTFKQLEELRVPQVF